jgi:hypothetical protein
MRTGEQASYPPPHHGFPHLPTMAVVEKAPVRGARHVRAKVDAVEQRPRQPAAVTLDLVRQTRAIALGISPVAEQSRHLTLRQRLSGTSSLKGMKSRERPSDFSTHELLPRCRPNARQVSGLRKKRGGQQAAIGRTSRSCCAQ